MAANKAPTKLYGTKRKTPTNKWSTIEDNEWDSLAGPFGADKTSLNPLTSVLGVGKQSASSSSRVGYSSLESLMHASKKRAKQGRQSISKGENSLVKNDREQLFIDIGQKDLGTKVCNVCSMVYVSGQSDDEKLHKKFHDKWLHGVYFPGWKHENVVKYFRESGSRVIMLDFAAIMIHSEKLFEIVNVMNGELGGDQVQSTSTICNPDDKIYLYIRGKRVCGCLIAHPITSAFWIDVKVRTRPECSTPSSSPQHEIEDTSHVNAVVGIDKIWVHHSYRRQGIASCLVDALRSTFTYGYNIPKHECAFSQPTLLGMKLAAAYFDSCDRILVYHSHTP